MNEYAISDMTVGMKEQFEVSITEGMLKVFAEITGDFNPLHVDEEYAAKHGHPGKVAYGLLTASFYSTLAGMYLPGKNCLLQECDVQFVSPVYAGDILTIVGEIKEIDERYQRIVVKAFMKNQQGCKVSRAKLIAGVLKNG